MRRLPLDLLPVLLVLPPNRTPEASLSGLRQTSGTKKSLSSLAEHWGITQNGLLDQAAFSISFPSFVHLSSALCPATATIRPYRISLPLG